MPMRPTGDGADGLIERGNEGNLTLNPLHKPRVYFRRRQAVDACKKVVCSVVQEPGAAVEIGSAVAGEQSAVRRGDNTQAVWRLHLLGGAVVRQHLFVRQQLSAEHGVGQRSAIERILPEHVTELTTGRHKAPL